VKTKPVPAPKPTPCAKCGKPISPKAFSQIDGKFFHPACEPELTEEDFEQ